MELTAMPLTEETSSMNRPSVNKEYTEKTIKGENDKLSNPNIKMDFKNNCSE